MQDAHNMARINYNILLLWWMGGVEVKRGENGVVIIWFCISS